MPKILDPLLDNAQNDLDAIGEKINIQTFYPPYNNLFYTRWIVSFFFYPTKLWTPDFGEDPKHKSSVLLIVFQTVSSFNIVAIQIQTFLRNRFSIGFLSSYLWNCLKSIVSGRKINIAKKL